MDSPDTDLLAITADIVSAHVGNNTVATGDVANLIKSVYDALANIGAPEPVEVEAYEPATTARKSLANPNHILSMINGKPYTMLKRHLAQNGLTPAEYRDRYNLPADYPMTAQAYSARRRELAHSFGLGRKKAEATPEPTVEKKASKPRKSAGDRSKAKTVAPATEADDNSGEA
ncbi:MucR family transcriptional regulator [Sphingomonas prati]|uniref:Putative transcriptional regulator n=1 Tax=Sphingomonas prati TaxID=1843237 RepID=A0A7W9BVE4_9SPHN|nr:MucR family transcriptional regulator [Sphingomonas prati]MBB5730851.1 putative transcriptional regulator [Sphingomonas prati]GGE97266.1 MucR family transcriptional regulator [Sphingomonas prati]